MGYEPDLYNDATLVRVCRALLGMNQKQFAKHLGLASRSGLVSLWENGHVPFPKARKILLIKILRNMNREIKWFLVQQPNETRRG
jgi:transcriptional regulator with XRE-family HTH domain